MNSALRYRAQAPLVDQMLSEIGVKTGDIGKLAGAFSAITAAEGAEPAELTHKKDKAK